MCFGNVCPVKSKRCSIVTMIHYWPCLLLIWLLLFISNLGLGIMNVIGISKMLFAANSWQGTRYQTLFQTLSCFFSNIIMFQFGFHVWHRMLHGERNLWLDGQSGQSHSYITGCLKIFYIVSKAIFRVSKNILQCVQKLFYSL